MAKWSLQFWDTFSKLSALNWNFQRRETRGRANKWNNMPGGGPNFGNWLLWEHFRSITTLLQLSMAQVWVGPLPEWLSFLDSASDLYLSTLTFSVALRLIKIHAHHSSLTIPYFTITIQVLSHHNSRVIQISLCEYAIRMDFLPIQYWPNLSIIFVDRIKIFSLPFNG